MATDYNDYLDFSDPKSPRSWAPSADPPQINEGYDYVPGPLTMTTIALFGNNTFFEIAVQTWNASLDENSKILPGERLCNLVPFARLEPIPFTSTSIVTWSDSKSPGCDFGIQTQPELLDARQFLSKWLHGFNDTKTAVTALSSAVFLANQAVVTMDQLLSRYSIGSDAREDYGRSIYSGYATTIRKPQLSLSVVIGMTTILTLQLLCLAILAWLIYRGPSETRSLDAMAFLRLKERMEEHTSFS
ncbi:hypothetical protein HBI56_137540 [Parastagonospora nodorum]|nr:hypothetical protein HBH46_158990 [Parastagonospora nodorum]KAH4963675.1 hypothetical protein HBI78_117600 [Parastagonospora nodorum]KAH5055673.1 hypothetical protein HBH96_126350 [Parastagonospora nodorum]KAH5096635.1 hypothetical protein HBH72_138520 [Parastagonospora nodorum]KAH5105363.1 hypothetical protein HBI73_119380 [Parastagonospora nodorum]